MSFKDELVQELLGGGALDWEMLDKCNYSCEDILDKIKMFTTIDEMDFNDLLVGAIDLYRYNIQEKIDEKITETESDLQELERYSDENNGNIDMEYIDRIELLRKQLDELQELCAYDDIEHFVNYIDTSIFINNDEIRALYKKYLSEEIEKENEEIGFVELDLE